MSTVISQLLQEVAQSPTISTVAYFFFDYKAALKQTTDQMLRSLLLQIIQQEKTASKEFEAYCLANKDFPGAFSLTEGEMLTMLDSMVQQLGCLYLVIDGLDECQDLDVFMTWLGDFEEKSDQHKRRSHHWLLSSQDIYAVSENLPARCSIVNMERGLVDADIESYVRAELESDPRLRNYSYQKKILISSALSSQSQGM